MLCLHIVSLYGSRHLIKPVWDLVHVRVFGQIFTQFSTSDSYQRLHLSLQQTHYCKNDSPLARRMSLHHGLTDLCDNHFTDSFMLEILSTGRAYL